MKLQFGGLRELFFVYGLRTHYQLMVLLLKQVCSLKVENRAMTCLLKTLC